MFFFGKDYPEKATDIPLWISLNLADLAVTVVCIMTGDGRLVEGNPVLAWMGGNVFGLVGYKITLTFAAIILLSRLQKLHLTKWLNIVMAAAVGWNLALLIIS